MRLKVLFIEFKNENSILFLIIYGKFDDILWSG